MQKIHDEQKNKIYLNKDRVSKLKLFKISVKRNCQVWQFPQLKMR